MLGPFQSPSVELFTERLGISKEAAEVYLASDVLDLHIESFSFHRAIGYDLRRRHGLGIQRGYCLGHADFPRILESGITGGTWSITTNPAQPVGGRGEVFSENLRELCGLFEDASEHFAVVRTAGEYEAARRAGKHGAFIGIQGGNAFDAGLDEIERCGDLVLRVTLLHLTSSGIGQTSSPLRFPPTERHDEGLSSFGKDYVRALNARRIGVDLAHISRRGFWDAVSVHDKSQPLLVTHTGVCGVHEHWRNVDDAQLRAVADSGGTVGIIYHAEFLGDRLRRGRMESVVRHIEHVVKTVGEDHASLGSDWDGLIDTPRDMPSCLELPKLVDALLRRGFSPESIQKILGRNFLRVVRDLRD
jgi:membrane dipeptidase